MKKLIFLWLILTGLVFSQKYFLPTAVETSTGRPMKNQDVDLYQSGSKIEDLIWLDAGRYYYEDTTVVTPGTYDIYVNGVSWQTNIWVSHNQNTGVLSTSWQSDIGDSIDINIGAGRDSDNFDNVFQSDFIQFGAREYGINNDSTDCTTQLRAALAATNTAVYLDSGQFLITDSVLIPPYKGIIVSPNARIIIGADNHGIGLSDESELSGGGWVIVDSSVAYTSQAIFAHGINESPTNFTISNIHIRGPGGVPEQYAFSNATGYGIYIQSTTAGNYAFFGKYSDLDIYGFEYGIYINGSATHGANGHTFSNIIMGYNYYNIYLNQHSHGNIFSGYNIQPRAEGTDTTKSVIYCDGDHNNFFGMAWDMGTAIEKALNDSAIHFDDNSEINMLGMSYYELLEHDVFYTDDGDENRLFFDPRIIDEDLEFQDSGVTGLAIKGTFPSTFPTASASANKAYIYYTNSDGAAYPHNVAGNLVLQPKSLGGSSGQDVVIATRATGETNASARFVFENEGIFVQDSLYIDAQKRTIADDDSVLLAQSRCGWGTVMIGDNQEYTKFRFSNDGTVTLDDSTSNVITTNTDGKLVIRQWSGQFRCYIKNRLGSTKVMAYKIHYYDP